MDAAPIVIINGAPRSGKSSIVAAMQAAAERPWMNLGVDVYSLSVTPERFQPGIGLRPGGERPLIAPLIPTFYAALYESIAAHSRLGLAVVADLGHQVTEPAGLAIVGDCARRLAGLPVLFVGVRAPIEVINARRRAAVAEGGGYAAADDGAPIPDAVRRWQDAVTAPGVYDMEVDTSVHSPEACAELVLAAVADGPSRPTAFERLAGS